MNVAWTRACNIVVGSCSSPPATPSPLSPAPPLPVPTPLASSLRACLVAPSPLPAHAVVCSPTRGGAMHGWDVPDKMPSYTCVSPEVAEVVCTSLHRAHGDPHHRDLSLVPVDHWEERELGVPQREHRRGSLLAADAAASGTFVASSPIHGLGVFAARPLSAGQHILPFYGQLVYHSLERAALSTNSYMQATTYGRETLPEWLCCSAWTWLSNSMELRMQRQFWRGTAECRRLARVPEAIATMTSYAWVRPSSRPIWIVPSQFCAAGYVNDPRPHGTPNVEYLQLYDPVCSSEQLLVPVVLKLVVTEDISVGEEIVADYGDAYIAINR